MSFTPQHFMQIQAAIRIVKATYEDLPCVDYSDDLKSIRRPPGPYGAYADDSCCGSALRISLTPRVILRTEVDEANMQARIGHCPLVYG